MQRDSNFSFYAAQIFFVGLIVIVSLAIAAILISVLGSNSVLAANDKSTSNTSDVSLYDSPNIITDGASAIMGGVQNALISTGRNFYANCKWVTGSITHVGSTIAHGSANIVGGTVNVVAAVGRGIGSAIIFPFKLPGKVINSIKNAHPIQSLVRPADSMAVPIINGQTSKNVLAKYSAEQQKQVAKLLAAQIAANQHLGGLVVAGDARHGGYPAKYANAPQDSLLDKWGMYNRECVSYAAWKVYQTYGQMPNWGGVGNASQWLGDARNAGIKTGSTPKVHSVAISMRGYYGHAMWVERVVGNMVYVSQYNYDLAGNYSEMWVNSSNFSYIYFK